MSSTTQTLEQVQARKQKILQGDPEAATKQAQAGKQDARKRIETLLDAGSFVELLQMVSREGQAAGVVTGYGTMDERPVCVFAQDFTQAGGAMSKAQAQKIVRLLDMAEKTGSPVIAMLDSAGARVTEGAEAVEAYAQVYGRMAALSGVVPTVSLALGPCVGGAAMISQVMDFTFMVKKTSYVASHGPQVIAASFDLAQDATKIGGAEVMLSQGGTQFVAEDEAGCFAQARSLLALLPSNNLEDAPIELRDDLNRLLPAFSTGADAHEVIAALFDANSFVEISAGYTSRITGLARLGGTPVAVVATNGGELCARGAKQIARLVRFADCYNMPIITLIDTQGLTVMRPKHQTVMIKAAAQLAYAYTQATCPKISIVTGYAIGAAFAALGGAAGADVRYAWPGAVIAPLMPEAAVQVLAQEKMQGGSGDAVAARAELAAQYAVETADGVVAAEAGLIDDVIAPTDTRKLAIAALQMIAAKRESGPAKKHGNLPL